MSHHETDETSEDSVRYVNNAQQRFLTKTSFDNMEEIINFWFLYFQTVYYAEI